MAAKKKKKGKKRKNIFLSKGALRFFGWTFGFITVLILGLIGIAAFYEEGIGRIVIKELKKTLKTELEVEKAELSLIWDFPRAAITLKNVKLRDTETDSTQYLLTAGGLSLKCGMFGLLAGSYTFNSIEISDATLFIKHDKKGLGNYAIFHETEDDKQKEPTKLNLKIENAVFNNLAIQYIDEKIEQDIKLKIKSSFFAGNFTDEEYDMTSYANIESDYIKIGNDNYFNNKELGYNAVIHIDNKTNTYTFSNIDVSVEANTFATNGKIALIENGLRMAIDLKSDKARLNSLLKLLPQSFEESFGGFQSNAKMKFHANVDGIYSDKEIPKIQLSFGLKNGRLTHPKMKSAIKSVSFDVNFQTEGGTSDHALFELKNLKGKIGNQGFEANLKTQGLKNPDIDFSANGALPIKAIYSLFGNDFSNGQGYVQLDRLVLQGKLLDMINPRYINKVDLGGIITFNNAGVVKNDIPLLFKTGKLELKNNIFSIDNLIFKSKNSDLRLNGNFQNLLPVLLSDSLNSKEAELGFKATLQSNKIDADELIAAFSSSDNALEEIKEAKTAEERKVKQDSLEQEKIQQRAFLTQFLQGSFKVKIADFKYGKIKAQDFKGTLAFENNILKLKAVQMNTMNGTMELNAKMVFEEEPYLLAFIDCNQVNVHQLFAQMENFGQETLQAKHLRGELNSIVKIDAFWDQFGNFLDNELVVIADVQLQNGELINLEMLESFSKYVKIKDLRHIRFTNLHNQFKIENKVFHMPAMFIQSNALNLTIAGIHSFDQDIDYKFKINAGQVIANKFKRHNPKMNPLPAKRKGLFNIYARMYGNLYGDYKFKLGPKNVKKFLANELDRELSVLTNTLKSEFEKSELLNKENASNTASKVTVIKEPEAWDDIPEIEAEKENQPTEGDDNYIDDW